MENFIFWAVIGPLDTPVRKILRKLFLSFIFALMYEYTKVTPCLERP